MVEDVVPDETLTLLTGEGGIGKTTLALQLAVAMRTDGDWLGMKVTEGTVCRPRWGKGNGRTPAA